ncbi:hypothetical protein D3C72_1479490 [compost metagenome]
MTKESGSTESGSSICPARAIGTTNSAARIRYIGNTQRARRRSWGSMFSTTVTWNCRGRQMIAIIATPVCTTIDGQLMVSLQKPSRRGASCALLNRSSKPSNRPKVTKAPTARNASSLTRDSKAMARTMPRWCSVTSRLRVPNTIENRASTSETTSAVSCTRLPVASALAPISRFTPSTMPLSCKAM